jgi:hypothetical protein
MMGISENAFTKKASEESAKSLFELTWSIFKDLGKKVVDEVKVRKALNEYTSNYLLRHGQIKVLGMPKPISVHDIYTDVKIISTRYLSREKEIEELEKTFRISRNVMSLSERKSGIDVVNETSKLNILGPPGSGKSTFLRKIGMEALLMNTNESNAIKGKRFSHSCIPVLIELKRFRNGAVDLKEIIQGEFETVGFPDSDFFVNKALQSGKLLILLDGIDEVPRSMLEKTLENIKDFTDKYKKNRFITSCRTAFYRSFLENFIDVEIAHFDNEQIKAFIKNWFSLEEDLAVNSKDQLIEQLFAEVNEATLELARTPLLLTFICLTFDDSQRFPSNKSSLYRRALMILIEKWAAEKRIHNEDIYQNLNSDLELEMLGEVAAKFYKADKIFFYHHEIKNHITAFLESSLNTTLIPISRIIEAIEVQQGLLVQRAPEIYSFSHLTIQEYLTAQYYYSPKRLPSLIEEHIFDNRWREVFLLLAGMGNADDLVLLIKEHLNMVARKEGIVNKTINWLDSLIPASEDFETDALKRIFVASLILRFKRYDAEGYARAIRLESHATTLIKSLNYSFERSFYIKDSINKKDAITLLRVIGSWQNPIQDYSTYENEINEIQQELPLNKMLHGSRQKFRKKILRPFYAALKVPFGIESLIRTDYIPLLNYLEAFNLLIECKNASLRISKGVWRSVCMSMLKNN